MEKGQLSDTMNKQTDYSQRNHKEQDADSTNKVNDVLKSSMKNVNSTMQANSARNEDRKNDSTEDLKLQLESLMNSLATLSAEKSRMEASFQADRKQLRSERDQCEKTVKDLKDRWKKLQNNAQSEMEHLKYKLIMERHEREKEQTHQANLMKELQKLVTEERRAKEQLEIQIKELKTQPTNKPPNKVLEAEVEILKNKLKQAEAAAKGTSPLLLSLQAEMTAMKKQHRIAIHEEHKRVAAAEQQARSLAMTHESRVAGLEARLTELSKTVGGYDRLRQKDQLAIQKLKEQLCMLQNAENKDSAYSDPGDDPSEIVGKIRELCARLMDLDKDAYQDTITDLYSSVKSIDPEQELEYRQKYESLLQEFEDFKKNVPSPTNASDDLRIPNNKSSSEMVNDKGQLHRLKTHCRNLEERIRVLNSDLSHKDKECKQKLENMRQVLQDEQIKLERLLSQKENEYRGKIMNLEQQIMRQRERSLAVINEKDQEIHTLKSSFQALLPRKISAAENSAKSQGGSAENLPMNESVTDLVTNFLTMDNNPPMLHYAQELARKDVQISGLRKQNLELEAAIREREMEMVNELERSRDHMKQMQTQIERLESCKSREGANLEYLKNVFVNYLISTDSSSKRHMLNAISTVLKFTSDEMEKIKKCK